MTRMKESGIDWIGQIPEEWEVTKLKYALSISNGKDYKDIEVEEGGFPVIGSGGVFARARNYMYDGDVVLLGRKGTIDKPLFYSGKFWTVDTMFYSTALNGNNIKFMYYSSLLIPFSYYSTATALPSMTQSDLNNHVLCLPSVPEQQKIADFLDKKTAQLDKVKVILEEQIKKLKDYRANLIYETVTKGLDKTVPMKDSGIDWIGQVPEGWGVSKLKNLLKIKDGTHDTPSYVDSGIPLITTKNINSFSNYIDFSTAKNISYKDYILINRRSDVEYGDILMPMIGTVGGAVQVTTKNSFSIKNVALFKAGFDLIMSKYLYYQLNSDIVNNQLEFLMSGGVQSFVSISILEQLQIINPSEKDKKKIVRFLDEKTQKIDKLIQIKNQQIENINKQRQTLIYDYVTGKRRV